MTSSGGELITTEHNPWFVGGAPVRYCIDKTDQFSPALSRIRAEVQRALTDWTATLTALSPRPTRPLPDGEPKNLSLTFVEEPCAPSTELRFRFGFHDEEIKDILKHHGPYTVALAAHDGIDERSGRVGRGIVWLAADRGADAYRGPVGDDIDFWARDGLMYGVLLHELGHVFGFEHERGTPSFMDEGYPAAKVARPNGYVQEFKPDLYLEQVWLSLDRRRCGRVSGGEALRVVFGVDASVEELCFTPVVGPFMSGVKLDVALMDASARVLARGIFTGTAPYERSTASLMVEGRYLAHDSGLAMNHLFIGLPVAYGLRGELKVGDVRWPALVEQRRHELSMTVVDASFPTLYREIGVD